MTGEDAYAGGASSQPTASAAAPPPIATLKNPPKPHFAFSVGIVGHRLKQWYTKDAAGQPQLLVETLDKVTGDIRLALEAIKGAVAQAYQKHQSLFARHDPELTLVSALADGADSFAAKAALALGYKLDAPLPFARADYQNDFSVKTVDEHRPAPRQEFHTLLGQARSVLELPGRRKTAADTEEQGVLKENRAYEAVGLTVLSQADILVIVWDRGVSRGRGGTAEMIGEAVRIGIPIVLVDANGERPIELCWRGLMPTPAPIVALEDMPHAELDENIQGVVDELVRAPGAPEQRSGLQRWFGETFCSTNVRFGFPLLMSLLFTRWMRCTDIFPTPPDQLANDDYIEIAAPILSSGKPGEIGWLANPYGWADAVAIYCSQLFRSAFVMNFVFAAAAVVVASFSVATREDVRWPAVIEFFLIAFVVGNTILAWILHWHPRWFEARELAERLRAALPLWTLGLRPAFFPGEEPTWTGWYARAVVRAQGLRAGVLGADGLAAERGVLLTLLTRQCGYNHSNAARMFKVNRRLEYFGLSMLFATVLVAFDHMSHLGLVGWLLGRRLPAHEATIWLSAALPALATASYGIRVIGDFEGAHQRGERTYRKLDELICAVRQDPVDFGLLRARARTAADAMLGDVASWRLSAESRGLAIPG
jgi:hypothetical protein